MNALLRVRALVVRLSGRRVVDEVSLDVGAGEVVGLIGPNGAGKSTLVRSMAGMLPAYSGEVRLGDLPVARSRPRELARLLAYIPQDTAMPFDLPAREVVAMGRYARHHRVGPTPAAAYRVADAALDTVGAAHLGAAPVARLSGGERQLVQLARAMAQEPRVILLDEPTAALDLHRQLHVLRLLRDQAAQGRGIAVVLHDLNHASRFCDRVVLLDGGRVRASGEPDHVLTEARLAGTYRVRATVRDDEDTRARRVTALHNLETAPPEGGASQIQEIR
ncbi:iron complex transport system ATP-binding protein [Nonomuraea maritima]|uniref:Iron complex transport system ATP-binding protein n=1 Tax=Nonomuraea maritima TaxID=683260 RepID=A0A1G9IWG8_9ACTN|nr:ABC transporter ATP-binding protein [Nonomuraea maritima]SDL29557.1 iron complex transport system ATP-binding protein [Nonomuraea maritima]